MSLRDPVAAWFSVAQEALRWSPPARLGRTADLQARVHEAGPDARLRFDELRAHYDLSCWANAGSWRDLGEALWHLDQLDRHVPANPSRLPALDVGARNWSYLPGLWSFRPGNWEGSELEAHRRYWNLTTRRASAEARCRKFPGSRYVPGDVRQLRGPYGLITWILPFVFLETVRRWGLPQAAFEPEDVLGHVHSLLAPGGMLWVVNQGERERDEQGRLFGRLGMRVESVGLLHSTFPAYRRERHGWRVFP